MSCTELSVSCTKLSAVKTAVDTVDTGAPATRSDLELLHDAEKLAEYRLGLTHDRVTR